MKTLKEKVEQKPAFARNIIARRKALGYKSAEAFAEAAGIPYPTLRNIELGTSPGLEETKLAIALALGCSIADLYKEDPPEQTARLESAILSPSTGELWAMAGDILRRLAEAPPQHRAAVLAILYNQPSLAIAPHSPRAPTKRR